MHRVSAIAAAILSILGPAIAEAAEKKGSSLPQLNSADWAPQLIWLAITFGVLYLLLSRIALPRISDVLEERRERIRRDLDEAARLKSETEKALADYEQALGDARGKAQAIARETRERLAAETDAERTRVEQQINNKIADAERRIADSKSQAMAQVNAIAGETAGSIVDKLIGIVPSANEVKTALSAPKS